MSRYQHDIQIKNYRKQNFFYMFIVKNSCFLSHFGTQNVRTETIYLNNNSNAKKQSTSHKSSNVWYLWAKCLLGGKGRKGVREDGII